jgi:TPP-dependent indolepyruvate ferredoxin oxidoreductase alpha subunit
LICEERMNLGVRGDDGASRQPCRAQGGVFGGFEAEVHQAHAAITAHQHVVGREGAMGEAGVVSGDEATHDVRWPWHSRSVEFCATCTAEYLVPALLDAAMQGRYALDQRYETSEGGPMPWAADPNVPTRQPAFCPYCGHSGAFDGQGGLAQDWYRHGCTNCGHSFATMLPPEVQDHA